MYIIYPYEVINGQLKHSEDMTFRGKTGEYFMSENRLNKSKNSCKEQFLKDKKKYPSEISKQNQLSAKNINKREKTW